MTEITLTSQSQSQPPTPASQRGRLRRLGLVHPLPVTPARWLVDGHRLVLGREPGEAGIRLDDPKASREHAELIYVPELDVYRLRDKGSRNGTFLDGRRIEGEYLHDGAVVRIGDSLLVYSDVERHPGLPNVDPLAGASLARAQVEALCDLAAPSTLPVLIHGPTGSGKEWIARRIHEKSGRRGDLVSANCGAFNKELLGSELFGHVRGAFSGAQATRSGLFASADGGTLFLDEIGELPLEQQPILLRALQERRIRPVGTDREVAVDARIVSATHQDLEQLERQNGFRADLLARLAGIVIELPGLAARREEVLPLFFEFLGANARPLSLAAAELLLRHAWPRNVRELQHLAASVALFAPQVQIIEPALLPEALRDLRDKQVQTSSADHRPTANELEKLLRAHAGNVADVARVIGCQRTQVYRWLKAYGLDAEGFRDPSEAQPAQPAQSGGSARTTRKPI